MKQLILFVFLTLIISFVSHQTQAQMFSSEKENIVFAPGKLDKEVTWSKGFSLKENGLQTETLPASSSQDIWIQTHPFPIGTSWRPPASAGFSIYFDGSIGDAAEFSPAPQVFIRYSCDRLNWSSWYQAVAENEPTKENLRIYKARISLPQAAREKYGVLEREWWKTNPAWSSDEHELCEWIIRKEPNFFVKEFPFIGYVQVRLEKFSVNAAQDIKSLTIESASAVSGLSGIPKDKSKVRKNTGDKWFFVGRSNDKELTIFDKTINEIMFARLF